MAPMLVSSFRLAPIVLLVTLTLLLSTTFGSKTLKVSRKAPNEMNQELHAFDQPGEAQEFYRLKRAPVGQHAVPVERYLDADDRLKMMPVHSSALTPSLGAWTYLGPGNIGGRTRALVINPSSPNIMYAGGVAGGLWKSTNAGASWNPKGDLLANLAIGCLAMDPNNSNVLYAGTGEGVFPGNDGDSVRGAGIFESTDAGETWLLLTKTADRPDFYYVNDIVVAPSGNVYAGTQTGVWRNLNGANKWVQVLHQNVSQGCLDLAVRTDQTTDYLFASYGSFSQASIYRNTDAGAAGTWSQVYTESNMGRTSLAIAPSNQNVIYGLASNAFSLGLVAVLRSTDSGNTWSSRVRDTDPTKLNTLLLTNPIFAFNNECYGQQSQYLNQGWYDNVIAVDPTDSNKVWAGGIDLFRSDDGGMNWGIASHWWANPSATQYAHSDQHVIVFHPGYNGTNNKTMYVSSDGGLFRTDDAQAATGFGQDAVCNQVSSVHWISLNNNYGVTQFYHGVSYPNGTSYFGGTQDNGTISSSDFAGANAWGTLLGGDGGYVGVDPTNTNTLYGEVAGNGNIADGRFRKSMSGGSPPWENVTPSGELGVNFLFVAPFIMDASEPQRLWTGGRTVWRSNDRGTSWCQASMPLADVGKVTTIAVAPTNPNQVLAGTWYGHIYRTSTGLSSSQNTTWNSVLLRNLDDFISCLTFDPRNASVAYATVSSFDSNPATDHHVYKSTDGGASWNPNGIDGTGTTGIPDIPVHCIVVDPNDSLRLYVGTDMGVLVSLDGGTTWNRENTGFANAPTEWLAINTNGDNTTLFAFTHGRGVWRVPISTALPPPGLSNLALNKTATQSSTVLGAPASRAVDGNTDGNFAAGSVSHTDVESEAWWHVDLGNVGSIKTIQVYNRTDCCSSRLVNYYVFVSDVPFTSNVVANTLSQTGVASYYQANSAESPTTITVNRTGRYVRVQLTGFNYLHIAEVRVWGTPYSLSSAASLTYESFAGNGGTGIISVYAPGTWTAVSNNLFITISSGSSGNGNGTVTYSVAANAGSSIRAGTMTINGQTFTVYQGINFTDVAPTDQFYTEIGKLAARGVTLGCGGGSFCASATVLHEQMAAFVMRAIGEPSPPQAPCDRFSDVSSSNIFHDFIERMGARGIWTGGLSCLNGNYCPADPVKREEMAAIMVRAVGEFNPPYPTTQRFQDVPSTNPYYSFVDRMAVLQITFGCSAQPSMYCPSDPVTRAQMAAFLVRAFKL